jgi:hypothetical protein
MTASTFDLTFCIFFQQEAFLKAMETIAPDLCITAAYGNMLPTRFLDIPKYGKSSPFNFTPISCYIASVYA